MKIMKSLKKLKKKIISALNINCFGKEKLLLAFEYGIMMSQVAEKQKFNLNTKVVKHAEEVILKEFKDKTPTELASQTLGIVLAIFETK